MTEPTELIGTVVEAEIGGRRVDAVVEDVEHVHESLNWRPELTLARNGSRVRVPVTAISIP